MTNLEETTFSNSFRYICQGTTLRGIDAGLGKRNKGPTKQNLLYKMKISIRRAVRCEMDWSLQTLGYPSWPKRGHKRQAANPRGMT